MRSITVFTFNKTFQELYILRNIKIRVLKMNFFRDFQIFREYGKGGNIRGGNF